VLTPRFLSGLFVAIGDVSKERNHIVERPLTDSATPYSPNLEETVDIRESGRPRSHQRYIGDFPARRSPSRGSGFHLRGPACALHTSSRKRGSPTASQQVGIPALLARSRQTRTDCKVRNVHTRRCQAILSAYYPCE